MTPPLAPELQTSGWLNTPQALTLAALRGKVIVLHAFQMLCPGVCNGACRKRSGCLTSLIKKGWPLSVCTACLNIMR